DEPSGQFCFLCEGAYTFTTSFYAQRNPRPANRDPSAPIRAEEMRSAEAFACYLQSDSFQLAACLWQTHLSKGWRRSKASDRCTSLAWAGSEHCWNCSRCWTDSPSN